MSWYHNLLGGFFDELNSNFLIEEPIFHIGLSTQNIFALKRHFDLALRPLRQTLLMIVFRDDIHLEGSLEYFPWEVKIFIFSKISLASYFVLSDKSDQSILLVPGRYVRVLFGHEQLF